MLEAVNYFLGWAAGELVPFDPHPVFCDCPQQLPAPFALLQLVPQPWPLPAQFPVPVHFPLPPQLSHLPSPFLSTKFLPWAQAAFASGLAQVAVLFTSFAFAGAAVADLALVFAGLAVEAVCEKATLAKKAMIVNVKKNLDAVFIVFQFK
jgi:hypothetical protein